MAELTIPLSEPVAAKLRSLPEDDQRRVAAQLQELAEEMIKTREFPGIYFMDGATGRRARVDDGMDVWEIIEPYLLYGKSWEKLRQCFSWLPEQVLRTAVAYYEANPQEIEARIASNQATEEQGSSASTSTRT